MRFGDVHCVRKVPCFKKDEGHKRAPLECRPGTAFPIGPKVATFIAEGAWLDLSALAIMSLCPRSYFLETTSLVRFGESRWLPEYEDKLFHGWS